MKIKMKGLEINATYINTNLVENDFRREEINAKENWLQNIWCECFNLKILTCYLYNYVVHFWTDTLACVTGVKRGRGRENFYARGRKERNACKDAIVFSIFHAQILGKH